MKLLNRKMHVFCISNIMTSFVLTSFLGMNYSLVPENEVSNNSEVAILDTDVDPLSHKGEEEKIEVTESKKEKKETKVAKKVTKKATTTVATVTKKEVKASKTYVPASYSAVTGQAVVDYAMKYLGLRYVSGGYSLSTGTDCSGFTKLIYREFGVNLSRAVGSQSKNGTYVSKSNLQKGDLVFYGYGNGVVRHVGIYIGNGQVLHESNPRDGVKINSVNMMQYITARRVINSTAIKMVEEKIESEKAQQLANTETTENATLDTDSKMAEVKNTSVDAESNEKIEEKATNVIEDSNNSVDLVEGNVIEESKELAGSEKENSKKVEITESEDENLKESKAVSQNVSKEEEQEAKKDTVPEVANNSQDVSTAIESTKEVINDNTSLSNCDDES